MRVFASRSVVLAAGALLLLLIPLPALAGPTWAPAGDATIHPGVQTVTAGGQCTSNFVFHDGSEIYLGQAAHCSSTGGPTGTNGCLTGSLPLDTPVDIQGADHPGTLVYNSWLTMQAAGETDPDVCAYNDFALVRIDPADAHLVNPSIPHWGGPEGLHAGGTRKNDIVYTYGNSSLRFGLELLSPKRGRSQGDEGGGWSHAVVTFLTPGIPGDSGSAFLDSAGRALGVLSTVRVGFPGLVNNGVGNLARELDYMRMHTDLDDVQLAEGTETFNGKKLPLGPLPPPFPSL